MQIFYSSLLFFALALNFIKLENIPLWLIIITPLLITMAIPISYFLYIKDKTILNGVKNSNLPLYNAYSNGEVLSFKSFE